MANAKRLSKAGPSKQGTTALWAIITRSLMSESGRFLPQPAGAALIAKCKVADGEPYCTPEYAPDEALAVLRQYDEALETLQEYGNYSKDAALQSLVYELRKELRSAAAAAVRGSSRREAARMRDSYQEGPQPPAFIDTHEIDTMDITGLEAADARELALHLKRWNPRVSKVYKRRAGRRFIHPDVRRVDLNNKLIKSLPFYEDLLTVVKERKIPVSYS